MTDFYQHNHKLLGSILDHMTGYWRLMKVFWLVYVERLANRIKCHDKVFTFTHLKMKCYERLVCMLCNGEGEGVFTLHSHLTLKSVSSLMHSIYEV
jgi:hypothetical protein